MNNITLWNLNDYSLQDIFDKVATHLLTQNKKSKDYLKLNKDGKPILDCTYRSLLDDNTILKCAIGCLIPDDKYNENFEGKSIIRLVDQLDLKIKGNIQDLLIHLQVIHDVRPVDTWYSSLTDTAMAYDLNTLALDKFK